MIQMYRAVSDRLQQIDFESLYPGFHPYPFALYTQQEAILDGRRLPTPDHFYGNTTIQYRGRQIAIWNIELDPPKSMDLLSASIVHEMFHAFQTKQGERRFPDDLALLAAVQTPETLAWKILERRLLADGAPFSHFCAARLKQRQNGAAHEEALVETAEGMAQWIEFCALGQISASSLADALEKCKLRLRDAAQAMDARRSGYDSGMYMLWRASESGLQIFHTLGQEPKTVFELLVQQVAALPEIAPPAAKIVQTAARLIDEQAQRQDDEAAEFLQSAARQVDGPFTICGYDPMNLWRQDDVLFSRSFIALTDAKGDMIQLSGKALLHMQKNSHDLVLNYRIPA